jgi:hypothetical protein
MTTRVLQRRTMAATAVTMAVLVAASTAHALIMGEAGNNPIRERAWPKGAVDVANLKSRIAWWEGPPYGGGEWHFEYRGDTATFNEALKVFARVRAPKLRLVVLDGKAQSFWLNSNRDADKNEPMDWTLTVWEAERFNRLFNNPKTTFGSDSENFRQDVPVPEITVYTGGSIDWSGVEVPKGIEVDDRRLEAHGYKLSDGVVIQATAWDITNSRPIENAELVVERIEPDPAGGYQYPEAIRVSANAEGKIVLKGSPAGWTQIILRADGYAPKIINYARDDQPRWYSHDVKLAKAIRVTGTVVGENGAAVAKANVRIDDVVGSDGKGYRTSRELKAVSDDQGQFTIENVPSGFGRFRAYADDYVFKGLGETQELNDKPVSVAVVKAGKLHVKVDFGTAALEGGYIIEVEPEGGSMVGSWGGSANLQTDKTYTFTHVPPGRYTLHGRPNPGGQNQQTDDVTTDVNAGEQAEVVLKAK